MKRVAVLLLLLVALAAAAAPLVAPYAADDRFTELLNAPPTPIHFRDANGWRRPFIHRLVRVNQLEQRYEEDEASVVPLRFGAARHLLASSDRSAPLLLLGADSFGRDVFSRLVFGARMSLGLSLASALGALLVGAVAGAIAGYAGGAIDESLMRGAEFVLVLPATYVALALRSVLPLVLSAGTIFLVLTAIFAVVGAPFIARGVRGIVRSERSAEYAVAARSLGASHARILVRHLLPSARGFIAVELTMLVPAFIVAEATLSFVGLGFPDPVASWGTMLHDAANIRTFADFPWLLSPAAAMFAVVLSLNLVLQDSSRRSHHPGTYTRPL